MELKRHASLNWDDASVSFAALGSEARLQVLRTLVRAGPEGLPVADIQSRTGIPASTLTHHLKFLAAAGVVTQEKIGRSIISRAAFSHLEDLAHFLLCECCADDHQRAANHG
ncbi:ArsR/SmtB family transcription factor [Primorskyibacter sp. S187A]|uniref:ArsR/SmtB family transcription factor n=1 Tax=Primorskyibacter sp. S187A TaxID=3415130 RepID=UPI003C7A3135